jgi:hypothetical protein
MYLFKIDRELKKFVALDIYLHIIVMIIITIILLLIIIME